MESLNYKIIIIIALAAALTVLGLLLLFQRKRGMRSSRNYYIDALHALIEGRSDDALKLLIDAVKMGESSTDAYLQLGNLLRDKGQNDRALQLHKGLMVRRDLSDAEEKAVTVAIADDFDALGKTDRAVQTLEQLSRRRKDPEIMLSLAGEGEMTAELKALTAELGLEDNVRFVGYIDNREIYSFLRQHRYH